MTWFKVDDKLHAHPKVEKAGHEAMGLWVIAGSYSVDQLTDGLITEERAARLIGDRKVAQRLAASLVEAGLWVRVEGGYRYHDWAGYQPLGAAVKAERERKARNTADHRNRSQARSKNEPVTGGVTGDVGGDLPVTYHGPDPDPDPRREDLTNHPPPPLHLENPQATAAGVSFETSQLRTDTSMGCQPPTATAARPDPATRAILEALTSSRKLRGLANAEYAQRLAAHCREHGHTGPKPLALVLEAIREADAKADTMEAGGEPITRLPAFVAACVKAGPKQTQGRAGAGKQPMSDRWAPKPLDASTLPLLAADDPERF